jgi:NADPH2:quinone reductase
VQQLVAPAASVVLVPDGATIQQACTLPMNGPTALLGLELLDLEAGQTARL